LLALAAEPDARRLEPEAIGVRHPPGGIDDRLVDRLVPVRRGDAGAARDPLHLDHVAADMQVDPGLAHVLSDMAARLAVEAAQDLPAPVELRDLHAHPVEDAGEFAGAEA